MRIYTFSQARQQLATLLDEASREGEVLIRRRDGSSFVVQPLIEDRSPLDVPGVSTDITMAEILSLVHEGRRPRSLDRQEVEVGKRAVTKLRTGPTSR